jgi:NAD(P)-dependent dehydrogenase (short-subunit alcohol dehydrogenase family)
VAYVKLAIITGGASGIGRAIGEALARRGDEVVLCDRQAELAEEIAGTIRSSGGRASAAELDVRSFGSWESLGKRYPNADYLFNNAGIAVGAEMRDYAREDWDDVIDVNLKGVCYGIQTFYPRMVARGTGHIINTASMAGLVAAPEGSYTATKHAVVGLSKALRVEAKGHGVRISVLCPGAIRTPILTGGEFGRIKVETTKEKIMKAWERVRPMDVDVFAQKALKAIDRDEAIIVLPKWWKALWMIERVSPSLSFAVWRRMLAQMRADLGVQ